MIITLNHDVRVEDLETATHAESSHMLGGMAHDFMNYIHIIAIGTNRMKRSTRDIRMLKQCDVIIDACHLASELVNEIICVAKGGQIAPHEMDLNGVVASRATLLERTLPNNVRLKTDLAPSLPPVRGNASEMGRVIMNLLNNARDAVREGGQIRIRSQWVHLEEAHDRGGADAGAGDFATVAISDTGPGISPHLLSKIFAPFVSTKNNGDNAGLGLTMARTIVKRHRGWIDVKSQIGQGASFTIYLPAVAANGDRKSD